MASDLRQNRDMVPGEEHETTTSWRRVITIVVLLAVVAVAGGLIYQARGRAPSEKFCTLGLAVGTVDGRTVVYQDQGGPGKDGCDLPDHGEYTDIGPTLGFDCKIRDGSGTVIDSVPQQPDGTCDDSG